MKIQADIIHSHNKGLINLSGITATDFDSPTYFIEFINELFVKELEQLQVEYYDEQQLRRNEIESIVCGREMYKETPHGIEMPYLDRKVHDYFKYVRKDVLKEIDEIYEVGVDIGSGDYYLTPDKKGHVGYFTVYKDKSAHGENDDYFNGVTSTHAFITVTDGQYVNLKSLVAVPADEAPSVVPKKGIYKDGIYRVGVDIPSGEYEVKVSKKAEHVGFVSVFKDGTYQEFVSNEVCSSEQSVTIAVEDGQYLYLNGSRIEVKKKQRKLFG